jgi:hypothetical protein
MNRKIIVKPTKSEIPTNGIFQLNGIGFVKKFEIIEPRHLFTTDMLHMIFECDDNTFLARFDVYGDDFVEVFSSLENAVKWTTNQDLDVSDLEGE